jgi:hypothetical protein
MAALALHIEKKLLEIKPDLDPAEVRSFSELITGIAGDRLRAKQEEINQTLGADLPDCFRAFCSFEKVQQNNEMLLDSYRSIIKDWIENGARDVDGTVENRITYLRMLASVNNMLLPTSKKDLAESKNKKFFMKVTI